MMRATDPNRSNDAGLSLIEVVIAVALTLFITTAVYKAFDRTTKQVTNLQAMIDKQSAARNALSGIQSELRNAYSGDESVPHVVTMTSTKISFYSADRSTPLSLRQITYELKSGNLVRSMRTTTNTYVSSPMAWTWGTWSAERTVASGVTNASVFTYRDGAGATTAAKDEVKIVDVTLTVKDPKAPTNQNPETFTTSVRMRGVG